MRVGRQTKVNLTTGHVEKEESFLIQSGWSGSPKSLIARKTKTRRSSMNAGIAIGSGEISGW